MTEPLLTISADQPTMDPRISMTVEPVFDDGNTISLYSSRIAPSWKYTDPAGHVFNATDFHNRVHDTDYYCVDCEDTHGDSIWLCNLCDAVIKPRYITGDMVWNYRNPDRLLYYKITITYVSDDLVESTYVTRDHTIAQSILDNGCMTLDTAARLEPYLTERRWGA